jgi:hypothetical protein
MMMPSTGAPFLGEVDTELIPRVFTAQTWRARRTGRPPRRPVAFRRRRSGHTSIDPD